MDMKSRVSGANFSMGDKHAAIVRTVLMFILVTTVSISTVRLYNVYNIF